MPETSEATRKTVCIKLSPAVWKQAKHYAVEHEMMLGQLVEMALLREIRRGHAA